MPGIVGLLTRMPREQAEPQLLRMVDALRLDPSYSTGTWVDESLGVYVGWSVREGSWNGVKLDGLNVIAVVRTDGTLGDQHYQPRSGRAVLVVDRLATPQQREALTDLARSMAGGLIRDVAAIRSAPMEVAIGTCGTKGCASVKAGNLVEITTRCLGSKDHLCGNEETFYPPLTEVSGGVM